MGYSRSGVGGHSNQSLCGYPLLKSTQHLTSTPFLLTVRYLTPLYGVTPAPSPRLFLVSINKLSTRIPLASQPFTWKLTAAEEGMRLLFALAVEVFASPDSVFFE